MIFGLSYIFLANSIYIKWAGFLMEVMRIWKRMSYAPKVFGNNEFNISQMLVTMVAGFIFAVPSLRKLTHCRLRDVLRLSWSTK